MITRTFNIPFIICYDAPRCLLTILTGFTQSRLCWGIYDNFSVKYSMFSHCVHPGSCIAFCFLFISVLYNFIHISRGSDNNKFGLNTAWCYGSKDQYFLIGYSIYLLPFCCHCHLFPLPSTTCGSLVVTKLQLPACPKINLPA